MEFAQDIVAIVQSFLTERELATFSLVCKEWYQVTQLDIIWKERVLRLFSGGEENPRHQNIPWRTIYPWFAAKQWKFDPSAMGRQITLDASKRQAHISKEVSTNHSVCFEQPFLPAENLVHYFELTVLSKGTYNIAIGMADKHFKLQENFVGYPTMNKQTPSWSYSSNGNIRNGIGNSGGLEKTETYDTGDSVGALVDFKHRFIYFFKNGTLVTNGKVALDGLIRTNKYWPTVTLYAMQDRVEIASDKFSISFWKEVYPLLCTEDRQPDEDRALLYKEEEDVGDEDDHDLYRYYERTRVVHKRPKQQERSKPNLQEHLKPNLQEQLNPDLQGKAKLIQEPTTFAKPTSVQPSNNKKNCLVC